MTRRSRPYRPTSGSTTGITIGLVGLLGLGLAGCADGGDSLLAVETGDEISRHDVHASASAGMGPDASGWLAGLRGATAPLHRIEAAAAAGWDARITGCMELPGTGGMGYHYGNVGLIDGVVEALAPELLLYEPQANGRLRLVAVEYVVPFTEWSESQPPALHGVSFHRNETFGLWVLHAWVWKHNPAGMFADWNPDVSCAFAG